MMYEVAGLAEEASHRTGGRQAVFYLDVWHERRYAQSVGYRFELTEPVREALVTSRRSSAWATSSPAPSNGAGRWRSGSSGHADRAELRPHQLQTASRARRFSPR
ncbi:MAG: hypothetical protein H6675_01965 [Dehalococcoidia bacterium]|nr:hypothetical protein [Dehalococcoidia bacterium]